MYQGQSGVGLINSWDINRIPSECFERPDGPQHDLPASQNYKPYPQFGAVNLISNFGHNTYHGGTVRVEKRYSAGLVLNAFYTFQKTLTENEARPALAASTTTTAGWRKAWPATTSRIVSSVCCLTSCRSAKAGVAEPWRLRESGVRRLGTHLDADAPAGPAVHGGISRVARTAICRPARSGRTSSPRTMKRRSQDWDDRPESVPDLGAESLPELQLVRLSGGLHGRQPRTQHVPRAGPELDAAIPGEVLEHRRACCASSCAGREQLPVQAAATSPIRCHV